MSKKKRYGRAIVITKRLIENSYEDKEKIRKEIKQQTEQFLKDKEITKIPDGISSEINKQLHLSNNRVNKKPKNKIPEDL